MSRRLGTYMMLVLSALLIVVGLKLVIDNWTVGVARQSFFPGISGVSQAGDAEADDWQLLLVNQWNSLPDGYAPELTELWNGESVDSRIYPDLQEMFDDARAVGLNPYVNSGYRTAQVQQSLMDEEINDYMVQGYSEAEARRLAEQWVAVPGTSEHQLGLAVDISMEDTATQTTSDMWQWLMKNSYKYGFILRYPEDKTNITGISYEPWHYRYVGREAAEEIYRSGLCLEEYLSK
ncbi:M15 family metallopeptidase [Frisingicoccus sp.]|uniref:M15 family metallopeptidase n=1 Tax=Frisingicoccus sp. TaxID=1918627 RepID=UPI003AB59613